MIKDNQKKALEFFGITEENIQVIRENLFKQIHEIIFHGNGGYDYYTVYNMPIWLRKYTFNEMKTHYNKESQSTADTVEASKKAMKSAGSIDNKLKPPVPKQKVPSYITKASK
jgi:hypothetical protein